MSVYVTMAQHYYALIGQNLTGEFMRQIYAASWNLFIFDSWSWQSFVSTCDVFFMSFSTGCTKWNTAAIKSLLLFMAGLFIGFLVEKCSILKLVYFDSWSWQSFLSTCDVFYCLFPLDAQNEIQLLSTVFCYSWLVCLLNFWLRNAPLVKVTNPISDDIVFIFHLAGCGLKSPSSGFQELHLEW